MVIERQLVMRVKKLWYFTLLAKQLIELKNFHGAMQVISFLKMLTNGMYLKKNGYVLLIF